MKQLHHLVIFLFTFFIFPSSLLAQTEDEDKAAYDTIRVHDPQHYNLEHLKIFYSRTANTYRMGDLLNGKKEGIWRTYYDNGMLSTMQQFHEDVLNGFSLMLQTSGMLLREDNFVNGKADGTMRQYSGSFLALEENYTKGILNGWRRVFDDGVITEEGQWKMGKRDSMNRWFYPDSLPSVEYYYKNGAISGPSKSYYENGKVKTEGGYLDNYEVGLWKEYSESGKESAEGNYKEGKKTGTWKIFGEDGKPEKIQEYQDGNLVKETTVKK